MNSFVCLLLAVTLFQLGVAYEIPTEKRLIKDLLDKYAHIGLTGRPVLNYTDTLDVEFGLTFLQLHEIYEEKNQMISSVWPKFRWTDALLRWDPKHYDGITTLRLPSAQIWTPDVLLFNDVDSGKIEDTLAVVYSTGSVLWIPRANYKSSCEGADGDNWQCVLKFGSWTYHGAQINLKLMDDVQDVDVSSMTENPVWSLTEHRAEKHAVVYECCPEEYIDLSFYFTFTRR